MEEKDEIYSDDYEPITHDFGEALIAMREGKRVARKGWNGKGLFVFMQIPSAIPISTVPKMQSLPDSVKNEFLHRNEANNVEGREINPMHNMIRYSNQFALVDTNNMITGWAPSASDANAEDWVILD